MMLERVSSGPLAQFQGDSLASRYLSNPLARIIHEPRGKT
ncbi:MAG: hypothetical protein ACI87A_001854, partial [Planctomycetota bacterium]